MRNIRVELKKKRGGRVKEKMVGPTLETGRENRLGDCPSRVERKRVHMRIVVHDRTNITLKTLTRLI